MNDRSAWYRERNEIYREHFGIAAYRDKQALRALHLIGGLELCDDNTCYRDNELCELHRFLDSERLRWGQLAAMLDLADDAEHRLLRRALGEKRYESICKEFADVER